jgi:hypothetical protein
VTGPLLPHGSTTRCDYHELAEGPLRQASGLLERFEKLNAQRLKEKRPAGEQG